MTAPEVIILLGTHNGAQYLRAQLDSFTRQEEARWDLWVSDDCSSDTTMQILDDFSSSAPGAVRLLAGPCMGASANFLSLLCHEELPICPAALSDQDDVWLPHKLRRALHALDQVPPGVPALYGAQSIHVTADLKPIGKSRRPGRTLGFRNALTQNMVSGHSAVLNAEALRLVRRAGPQPIPFHDWWLYQLISGAGGQIIVDQTPVLLYRQHNNNVLGAHAGIRAGLERLSIVLGREYGQWIEANLAALNTISHSLTPENRDLVQRLRDSVDLPGHARASMLWKEGLYRQTKFGNAAFYAATMLGRI